MASEVVSTQSFHPVPSQATGEVVGAVLEALQGRVGFAILLATHPYAGAIEDVAGAVQDLLDPDAFLAAVVEGFGVDRSIVTTAPALALLAGTDSSARPFRIESDGAYANDRQVAPKGCGFIMADPFSLSPHDLTAPLDDPLKGISMTGGFLSAARAPGRNHMYVNGKLHSDGAVGMVFVDAELAVTHSMASPFPDDGGITFAPNDLVDDQLTEASGDTACSWVTVFLGSVLVPVSDIRRDQSELSTHLLF